MKDLNIEETVAVIVSRITGRNVEKINPNGDLKNELALDSVQIVELFASLEQEFQVELPLKLMTVRTSKEFLRILEESLKSAA
jgi:acyl carrier protein